MPWPGGALSELCSQIIGQNTPHGAPEGVYHPPGHLYLTALSGGPEGGDSVLLWGLREAEWPCPGSLRGERASCLEGGGGKGRLCKMCPLPRVAQLPWENEAFGAETSPHISPLWHSRHLLGPALAALAPAVESNLAGKQRLFVLPGHLRGHPETSSGSLSRASAGDQGPPDEPSWPRI